LLDAVGSPAPGHRRCELRVRSGAFGRSKADNALSATLAIDGGASMAAMTQAATGPANLHQPGQAFGLGGNKIGERCHNASSAGAAL